MEVTFDFTDKLIGAARTINPVDRFINNQIANRFWRKVILPTIGEIENKYVVSSIFSLKIAFNSHPFKGLINSIFQYDQRSITNQDLAVALYLSLMGHTNSKSVSKELLIEASSLLTKNIFIALLKSRLFKSELTRFNKDINQFNYLVHRDTVLETISSNEKLFRHHFKQFQEDSFHDFIKVWYPKDGQSWIDWNPEQTIVVNLDTTKIPQGFYFQGVDYSNKDKTFLKEAIRKDGFEYFNKSVKNGEIAWLR